MSDTPLTVATSATATATTVGTSPLPASVDADAALPHDVDDKKMQPTSMVITTATANEGECGAEASPPFLAGCEAVGVNVANITTPQCTPTKSSAPSSVTPTKASTPWPASSSDNKPAVLIRHATVAPCFGDTEDVFAAPAVDVDEKELADNGISREEFTAKFSTKCLLPYADQAKWWLDCFWEDGASKNAEDIYDLANLISRFDDKRGACGCELEMLEALKFLEKTRHSTTRQQLRNHMGKLRSDAHSTCGMALLEFLLHMYPGFSPVVLATRPPWDPDMILKEKDAAAKLAMLQGELGALALKMEELSMSSREQKEEEDHLSEIEASFKSAVAAIENERALVQNKKTSLEMKANDASVSTVTRSKAFAELQQLIAEDPMPVQKAVATQKAQLKLVTRKKAQVLAKAKMTSEHQEQVDEAEKQLESQIQDTAKTVSYLGQQGAVNKGTVWWMERQLADARKYASPKSGKKGPRPIVE